IVCVGFWPTQCAVVVAHQGTDPLEMRLSLSAPTLNNRQNIHSNRLPDVPRSVQVHSGFAIEHRILPEVKGFVSSQFDLTKTIRSSTKNAALAELDALFPKLDLPTVVPRRSEASRVTFETRKIGSAA
ncbi:hypothetical protein DFH94DRAFT_634690, partial [Russula ochroleuca]